MLARLDSDSPVRAASRTDSTTVWKWILGKLMFDTGSRRSLFVMTSASSQALSARST